MEKLPQSELDWRKQDAAQRAAKDWAAAVLYGRALRAIGQCAHYNKQWNCWVIDPRAVEGIADHNVRELVKAALKIPIGVE